MQALICTVCSFSLKALVASETLEASEYIGEHFIWIKSTVYYDHILLEKYKIDTEEIWNRELE